MHAAYNDHGPLATWLGLVEDGGELAVLSLTVAWSAGSLRQARAARVPAPPGRSVGRSALH